MFLKDSDENGREGSRSKNLDQPRGLRRLSAFIDFAFLNILSFNYASNEPRLKPKQLENHGLVNSQFWVIDPSQHHHWSSVRDVSGDTIGRFIRPRHNSDKRLCYSSPCKYGVYRKFMPFKTPPFVHNP